MPTVREAYEESIRERREWLRGAQAGLAALEEHCPELLALEAPGVNVYARSLSLHDHEDKGARALGVQLLEITGAERATVRLAWNRRDRYAAFEVPGLELDDGPFLVTLWRESTAGCHKARVTETKVIEFCGDLDERKYDNVEYLDE